MATTIDHLLLAAQSEVWAAATSLPDKGASRKAAARETLNSYLAAWPHLAAASRHALESANPEPGQQIRLGPVLTALDRSLPGRHTQPATPNPHLMRAAALTAAAGDAMTPLRMSGSDPRITDRILATLESAANLTAVYAEHLGGGVRWLTVAQAARELIRHDPVHRANPTASRSIVALTDTSLAATLDRWYRAARDATAPTQEHPSRHLPIIGHTLAGIHRAAALTGGGPAHHDAARAWHATVEGWTAGIRLLGPDDPDITHASAAIATALSTLHADHQAGHAEPTDVHELRLVASHAAPDIGRTYAARIDDAVRSDWLVIAARRLLAHTARPAPLDLADAARHGRWVPLPRDSPPAQHLLTATTSAVARTTHPTSPTHQALTTDAETIAARRARLTQDSPLGMHTPQPPKEAARGATQGASRLNPRPGGTHAR